MDATYMYISEIMPGKVVAEDIFANTKHSIIPKNTKINFEHLHVLKAFNISRVLIFKDEEVPAPTEINGREEIIDVPVPAISPFFRYYEEGVAYVKKEFQNWQAGARIDITKIRNIMLPLLEIVLAERSYIYDLNSYSTPQDYVYHHCIATGLISSMIVQKIGYDRGTAIQMALAGMLADCGMAKVPARVRDKKTALSEQEFLEIRKHPNYSYQMVKDLTAMKTDMKKAIYYHHERLDGSGYPEGNRDANVLFYSQVIAVGDVFHAMTSERLYRAKQSPFRVIEMIKEEGFGKFDIKVVQALSDIVADLPIGTKVELSNMEHAEVMFINPYAPTRPLVKLYSTKEIIDLATIRQLYISRILLKS